MERSEKEKAGQRKLIEQREKERKRMKRMMTAAFDGVNDEILSILEEVNINDALDWKMIINTNITKTL